MRSRSMPAKKPEAWGSTRKRGVRDFRGVSASPARRALLTVFLRERPVLAIRCLSFCATSGSMVRVVRIKTSYRDRELMSRHHSGGLRRRAKAPLKQRLSQVKPRMAALGAIAPEAKKPVGRRFRLAKAPAPQGGGAATKTIEGCVTASGSATRGSRAVQGDCPTQVAT